ncbi:MAG TPA: type I 3-dehydroquinate dehydratase [Planctomycetaceae bacterium]|nr:type I 3-dehydroquinate dehydratase [Planctomycetaceae bacterium]
MLCISVAPVSRSLAKADLLNAANQCDLVEFCIDHFIKEPDVGDLVKGISKPILIACRRAQDGGKFEGTDEERMLLLRQAIVASPEYIELDLEAAAKVPRFGKTKRLIDVTSLSGPPDDLDAIFEEAAKVQADGIKFSWPTPTFEAAWPLIKLLSKKGALGVVGLGIGKASVTVTLVGKMLEAPWSYAALEKGLESVPGQPTVSELKETYAWDEIGPRTRFVGLVGPIERQTAIIARVLNAAFRQTDDRHRCLPLPIHSFDHLLSRVEGLKIQCLLVAPNFAVDAAKSASKREGSAEPSGYADLLLHQPDGWTAYNTLWRRALAAAEERLGKKSSDEHSLARRNVLIVGSGGMAPALIYGVQKNSGIVSITGPDEKAAQQLAQKFNVRHVPFHSLYDTLADVVVIADAAIKMGHQKTEINAGYFRSTMLVMDLCAMPYDTELLAEVRSRGCKVVEPGDAFRGWMAAQFESICGKKFPTQVLDEVMASSP